MENLILNVIENGGELILVCSIKSYIFDRNNFAYNLPKIGDTVDVHGNIILINGQQIIDKTVYPADKIELDRMFNELPELFQHRINMLRLNVPDFDIFHAKEEIENCYAAYQQSLKPWKIIFDEKDNAHFWVGEPTIIDKLCMAYRFKDHDNMLEDELMLFDQGKNLALPRVEAIQRYKDYLSSQNK